MHKIIAALSPMAWVIVAIIILTGVVRLHRITNPALDWHAFRQADTASVTREYLKHGIDPLRPQYHDLGNTQSGLYNPEGWRMVEFPISNIVQAFVIRSFLPSLSPELSGRITSVLFSMGTVWALFYLVLSLSGKRVAIASALTFALIPFGIFYGRSILPEPGVVFFLVVSVLYWYRWLQQRTWLSWIIWVVSLALALLLKPFALFFGLVYIALFFGYRKYSWQSTILLAAGGVALAVVPFGAWRWWIQQFPEGIPGSDWLFNGNGIRLRPAWFRWLGYERLFLLLLGGFGMIPVVLSWFHHLKTFRSPESWVYLSWWASVATYFVVIATGNIQHDYYQTLILPIVTISFGYGVVAGFDVISKHLRKRIGATRARIVGFSACSLIAVGAWMLAWTQITGFFNVNHWNYYHVGEIVDGLVPEDALVVAPAQTDTQFLYQTNRRGWATADDLDTKIRAGATHLVTTDFTEQTQTWIDRYFVISQTEEYVLLDLTRDKPAGGE
jgi:hypothetical protein